MAIYTRDNINYGGMLQTALQNKSNYLKNRYDRVAQMGQNWGNAVANSGKVAQDAMFKIAGNYYDQDKIAQQQQFQASEAEKRAVEAMERQKEQQKFQEAQNALNRQNTLDVAKLNKELTMGDKQDEYQLRYQKARVALDLAKTILASNKKNKQLQKAVDDAQFDLDYWAKKAGVNVATTPATVVTPAKPATPKGDTPEFDADFLNEVGYAAEPPKPEDDFDNDDITANLDELFKVWNNANKATAQDLVSKIQDPALKSKYEKMINNAGQTIEERKAAAAAFKAKAQASYDALPKLANGSVKPGAFAKWKKANPKYATALGK